MTGTGKLDYEIHIMEDWGPLKAFLEENSYENIVVLTDTLTREYCWPALEAQKGMENALVLEIKSGEQHKSIDTCQEIWKQLMNSKIGRKALFVNLGGGVVGDLGGFCASTYMRGLDFVQVPTTLLSQVDASVGGKLGVDFGGVKNSVGLFQQPKAVFVFPGFLLTLPERELRSGWAEVIKHALIEGGELWQEVQVVQRLDTVGWMALLPKALNVKKRIVLGDPYERGLRKVLNYGHTIGHAVEAWALERHRRLLHGEAIAIGMICEGYLSVKLMQLDDKNFEEIRSCIGRWFAPFVLKKEIYEDLWQYMVLDKKNFNNQIRFSLLNGIGTPVWDVVCSKEQIFESMDFYMGLNS